MRLLWFKVWKQAACWATHENKDNSFVWIGVSWNANGRSVTWVCKWRYYCFFPWPSPIHWKSLLILHCLKSSSITQGFHAYFRIEQVKPVLKLVTLAIPAMYTATATWITKYRTIFLMVLSLCKPHNTAKATWVSKYSTISFQLGLSFSSIHVMRTPLQMSAFFFFFFRIESLAISHSLVQWRAVNNLKLNSVNKGKSRKIRLSFDLDTWLKTTKLCLWHPVLVQWGWLWALVEVLGIALVRWLVQYGICCSYQRWVAMA